MKEENKLEYEKEFYQNILDTAKAIILVLDLDGKVEYYNPYMEELSGYKLEEKKGTDWFSNFLPKEDRSRIKKVFIESIKDVFTKGNINPIITKDGKLRDIEWYNKALRNPEGKIVGTLIIGTDITEKKKAREELKESAEKFRRLTEASFEGILLHEGGKFILANNQFCKMFGYNCSELEGKDIANLLVAPESRELLGKMIMTENPGPYEAWGLRKDKIKFLMEIKARKISYGGKEVRVAVMRDITQQKEAEGKIKRLNQELEQRVEERTKELKESNTKYKALFDYAPDAVTLSDIKTGKFLYFNKQAYESSGYTREEFSKLKISDIEGKESPVEVKKHIEELLKKGNLSFESKHKNKDGEIRDVLISAKIIDINGKLLQSVWKDITEMKKVEQELLKANKKLKELDVVKRDFLNSISHELKTPLTAMMAHLDVLGDVRGECINEGTDKKQCGLSFEAIKRNSKQLGFFIDNLLEFSRMQSKTFKLDITSFNVRELVLQVVNDFLPFAIQKKLKIYYSVSKTLDLLADKDRVREILYNLIHNAINFTKKGKVMIRVRREGESVSIAVEDSGIGIRKEDMPNLFERFFQVKHGLKKGEDTGSGLGLVIVNQLVQLHGGKVFVKSQFGKGSTFTVKLPVKGLAVKKVAVKKKVVAKKIKVPLKGGIN